MAKTNIERHHWVNAFVGILDQAFYLNEEEQVCVIEIVDRLFTSLQIPLRGESSDLPMPVALEAADGFYSRQMEGPRSSGIVRPARPASSDDIVVSVEAWQEALLEMIVVAYPNLSPVERLTAAKIVTDLLIAVGVPNRNAVYYPADVVRTSTSLDG